MGAHRAHNSHVLTAKFKFRGPRDLSVFDMFKIGIGPFGSFAVGPVGWFVDALKETARLPAVARDTVDLYCSQGLTGRGQAQKGGAVTSR